MRDFLKDKKKFTWGGSLEGKIWPSIKRYTKDNPVFRKYFIISYIPLSVLATVFIYSKTGWFFALITLILIAVIYCFAFIWLLDYWDTMKTSGQMIASIMNTWRKK